MITIQKIIELVKGTNLQKVLKIKLENNVTGCQNVWRFQITHHLSSMYFCSANT